MAVALQGAKAGASDEPATYSNGMQTHVCMVVVQHPVRCFAQVEKKR